MRMSSYNPFFRYKCLLYPEHLRGCVSGDFLPPVTLHIYPTNRCNQYCPFCIMRSERGNRAELTEEVFSSVVDEANDWGVKCIHVSGGGEPTLYPYLHYMERFGGFKTISTNGSKLTPGIAGMFDRVRISINAGAADVWARLSGRQAGEFAVLQDRVRGLAEVHSDIGIAYLLYDQDVSDAMAAVRMADRLGVHFFHLRPAWSPGQSVDMVRDLAGKVDAIRFFAGSNNFDKLSVYASAAKFTDGEKTFSRCLASPLTGVVTADGRLSICQDTFLKWGDLGAQSIRSIWGGADHHATINKVVVGRCPRCVMTAANEVIENCILNNKIIKELL